jgi:hypothetical protein
MALCPFLQVREGLLDGTTWLEIDHTDSLILASTTGTWTEAISNLHEEERKGKKLWSRIQAATFDPVLTSKLRSVMKKATTAATLNSVKNYDAHRHFKSMVAPRNLKKVAFTQFSANSAKVRNYMEREATSWSTCGRLCSEFSSAMFALVI